MITAGRLREVLDYDAATGTFKWRATGKPAGCSHDRYDTIGVDKVKYLAHRLAWLHHYGELPKGQIDHVDGNRRNNAIANLRDVSARENCRNKPRNSTNKSGVFGVHWSTPLGKWCAQINIGGRVTHIGYFEDLGDAAAARKAAERELGYHPNHGRAA